MLPCLLRQKYRNNVSGASPKFAHSRKDSVVLLPDGTVVVPRGKAALVNGAKRDDLI